MPGVACSMQNERRIEQINKEMELRNKQHNSSVSILKKHEVSEMMLRTPVDSALPSRQNLADGTSVL